MAIARLTGSRRRGESIIETMVIDMNEAQIRTADQVRQVLAGTQELLFRAAQDDAGRSGWIEAVLQRLGYHQLGRSGKGAVLAYLATSTPLTARGTK